MRTILSITAVALVSVTVAGCMSAEDPRLEGISLDGGNAIAYNNALQRIDPWPAKVQDTDLVVPAEYPKKKNSGSDSADASGGMQSESLLK